MESIFFVWGRGWLLQLLHLLRNAIQTLCCPLSAFPCRRWRKTLMKLCGQNAYMQSIVQIIPMFFYSPFKCMPRIQQIRRTVGQVIPTYQNSLAFPNFQGRVSCCKFTCKVRRCYSIKQNVRLHESKNNDISLENNSVFPLLFIRLASGLVKMCWYSFNSTEWRISLLFWN